MSEASVVSDAIDDLVALRSREGLQDKIDRLLRAYKAEFETYTEEQAGTVGEVIARLVAELTLSRRVMLSERLARDPKAPGRVIENLAMDDQIDVAAPVLVSACLLSDEALIRVLRSKGQTHWLAISRRSTISNEVAEILAKRGNRLVLRCLERNPGVSRSVPLRRILAERQQDRYQEKRRAPRRIVDYPGELRSNDGTASVRCRLKDISLSGARLVLAALPAPAGPLVLSLARDAIERPCEVVWQDGTALGVRFSTPDEKRPSVAAAGD